jgi:hypothetical protein
MKTQLRLTALCLGIASLFGCKKEFSEKQVLKEQSVALETSSATLAIENPVCGQYVQLKMVDYYPTSYYMQYATVSVGNDAENIFITFNSLNGFDFTKLKLVLGDLAHLQTILGPYTEPPTAQVGPANPDYSMTFQTPVPTHTFTIPRSAVTGNCFYLYAWAFGEKYNGTYLSDWRSSWLSSTTKINSDNATSYTEYCLQDCAPVDCGQLRTQTPGGWGAPPEGKNPASYMYAHFDAVFPNGLTVGAYPNNYYAKFAEEENITEYLPAGGQAKKLTKNYLNPATSDLKNVLVNHLVALTLSVKFDAADPDFGSAGMQLGNMQIGSGVFNGWTVNNFLIEANKVLGGTSSAYSIDALVATATAINENYVDGKTDNHYLVCPRN